MIVVIDVEISVGILECSFCVNISKRFAVTNYFLFYIERSVESDWFLLLGIVDQSPLVELLS